MFRIKNFPICLFFLIFVLVTFLIFPSIELATARTCDKIFFSDNFDSNNILTVETPLNNSHYSIVESINNAIKRFLDIRYDIIFLTVLFFYFLLFVLPIVIIAYFVNFIRKKKLSWQQKIIFIAFTAIILIFICIFIQKIITVGGICSFFRIVGLMFLVLIGFMLLIIAISIVNVEDLKRKALGKNIILFSTGVAILCLASNFYKTDEYRVLNISGLIFIVLLCFLGIKLSKKLNQGLDLAEWIKSKMSVVLKEKQKKVIIPQISFVAAVCVGMFIGYSKGIFWGVVAWIIILIVAELTIKLLLRTLSILLLVCFIVLAMVWQPDETYIIWLIGGITSVVAQILNYADGYLWSFALKRRFPQISQVFGSEWVSSLKTDFYRAIGQAPIVLFLLVLLTLLARNLPSIGMPLLAIFTCFAWIMVIFGWLTSFKLRRELHKKIGR